MDDRQDCTYEVWLNRRLLRLLLRKRGVPDDVLSRLVNYKNKVAAAARGDAKRAKKLCYQAVKTMYEKCDLDPPYQLLRELKEIEQP